MLAIVEYDETVCEALKDMIMSIDDNIDMPKRIHFNTMSWLNRFMNDCLAIDKNIVFEIEPANGDKLMKLNIKTKC